jgi:hypothetical protein
MFNIYPCFLGDVITHFFIVRTFEHLFDGLTRGLNLIGAAHDHHGIHSVPAGLQQSSSQLQDKVKHVP